MKQTWERPKILATSKLPDVLGDCTGGLTELATSCENGGNTGTAGHTCQVGDIQTQTSGTNL